MAAGTANTAAIAARKIIDRVMANSDLTDDKRHAAGGNANEQRADNAGAAMKRQHADTDGDEKRQGIDRQREDQPAEQADADGVENKSKGEHGGGSMCIDVTVAPSTTTAAQFWT